MISPHLTTSDKAALARVCKSLHDVANHDLCGTIDMRWNTGTGNPDPGTSPPIHLLLRTVLEDPKLAHLVTEVRFTGSKSRNIWRESMQPELDFNELDQVMGIV